MEIGKLNRRVTIKSLGSTQDAIGQPVQTWTDVATVWADIRFTTGSEAIKADQPASAAKASIRIRWRTDVRASMRVYLGSKIFEIKAVLPDEAGKSRLDLACELVNG